MTTKIISLPRDRWSRCLAAAFFVTVAATPVRADTAYGTLSNFDTVNDTGGKCHGFEIELEDVHSSDVTYTYDWNHYGRPTLFEDNSDPAHPRVFVRHESKRNPDGTFASFTNPVDPANPIGPTSGHACTNPSVNFGCEHFGVGLYRQPSRVSYHWLVEDPGQPGTLILGPAVSIGMPTFVYYPPVPPALPGGPPAAPARVVAVMEPPEPPEPAPDQFGPATWVKAFKTVQPRGKKLKLDDLLSDDEEDPNDVNWDGDEPAETEVEWMVFQKRPASNPGDDEIEGADELPEGDEQVTRRYEFYTYLGPVNEEDGEAKCDNPDDCPGAVGGYLGAQMVGFNVEAELGLIGHLQEGELFLPYTDRTVVVGGNTPYVVTLSGGAAPGPGDRLRHGNFDGNTSGCGRLLVHGQRHGCGRRGGLPGVHPDDLVAVGGRDRRVARRLGIDRLSASHPPSHRRCRPYIWQGGGAADRPRPEPGRSAFGNAVSRDRRRLRRRADRHRWFRPHGVWPAPARDRRSRAAPRRHRRGWRHRPQ